MTSRDATARDYVEQWLFERSPFGVWATGGLIYLFLVLAFGVATLLDHGVWFRLSSGGVAIDHQAWLALVLAFIPSSNLALQRFSRLRERRDAERVARTLKPGTSWTGGFSPRQLRIFTVIGFGLAFGVIALLVPWRDIGHWQSPARFIWFSVVSGLLGALFFRGLCLTSSASRHAQHVIETGLVIDLLNIESLYPWGRSAARTALIWFAVSGAVLLMFIGSPLAVYLLGMVAACAALGIWVFVRTLSHVHQAIRRAKAAELEGLRAEITQLRGRLDSDPSAAAKPAGLLAYEARIAAAPEWPFDQTILMRLGASSLIVTVPWFGQAFAAAVVEQMRRGLG